MNKGSRTANSLKSAATAVGGQVLNILLKFVSRTVFINTIGAAYLGVNGLFTSVLTILNISELGLSSAIVYSLYKPLAQGDKKTVSATMNLLRRAYFVIGAAVLLMGLVLHPFLPYLMKGTTDLVDVDLVYALYVFNSVFSYWFYAYKPAVLQADQKKYVSNIVNNLVTIATVCVQIAVLALFRSFIGYVAVQLLGGIVQGLIGAVVVNKRYPYLKENRKEQLPKDEKKKIFKNLFAMSLYKISSAVLSATDNLIISAKISTLIVGIHSNYVLILSAVTQLVQNIFSAFTASVGNLFAVEKKEKSEFVFRCLNFLNFWIYGFCAVCLWNLFNPFIELMWGKDMLFDDFTVLCIVLNFLTAGLQNAVISYKDACGLFWQGRYRPAASAALNIIVSLLLVKPLGVAGVFLGTIISRFLTTWWFDARLVHRHAFGISPKKYYLRYVLSLVRVCLVGGAISFATLPLQKYGTFAIFAVRLMLCLIVPNVYFLLRFRKTEEFKYLFDKIKPILKKIKR